MYKPMDGICVRLECTLWPAENSLEAVVSEKDAKWFLDTLEEFEYTYMELRDGRAHEIVKLENYCGRLFLHRGMLDTTANTFPCGSVMCFAITKPGIEAQICHMDDCEETNMSYVQMAGFESNLAARLEDIDTDLPIFEEHEALLKNRLRNSGDYTYLKIYDNTTREFVKVVSDGENIRIERGTEETKPAPFAIGSCVKWEITSSAVRDIVCQMDCCPDEGEETS